MLNEDRLHAWCERIQLPEEATAELARIASLTLQDKTLLDIFREFYEKNAVRWDGHGMG